MDDTTFITILSLIMISISLFVIIAVNFKWMLLGFKIMFKKFQSKNNVGLYFLRSKGNNFNIPFVVDLNKTEEEVRIGGNPAILPINRADFEQSGLFFGLPYKMANDDDVKTSLGLVYHQTDDEGKPIFIEVAGEKIPYYAPIKNSISVSGKMLKALVDEKAISDALKDFLQKNQLILILIVVNLIIAGVAAYFGYELMSNALPNAESLIRSAISEINNKLDLILEAVK